MSIKIAIIVEGKTEETALKEPLNRYLKKQLGEKPLSSIKLINFEGLLFVERLKRYVKHLLESYDYVVALTDVLINEDNPPFANAAEAKQKLREIIGDETRFHPHAAQHCFEAWLIPYWHVIQAKSGTTKAKPSGNPENHSKPHKLIGEAYLSGKTKRGYEKAKDAVKILENQDLAVAAGECAELRALLDTLLNISQPETA